MRPHVTMSRLEPDDLGMLRWVYVMAHHGGGGPKVVYGSHFFQWLIGQLLMIENYSYEGANVCEDLDISLPKGKEWDD